MTMNNKKMRILLIIQVVSLLLTLSVVVGLTYYLIEHRYLSSEVDNANRGVKSLEFKYEELKTLVESKDYSIYVPKKGVDYFDGKDSFSTHTVETVVTKVIEQIPVDGEDGLTAQLQCNPVKNRWEIRYSQDELWKVLKYEGQPTKCTVTINDILEALGEHDV